MNQTLIPVDHEAREVVRLDQTHHLLVEANPGSGKTHLLTEKLLTEIGPDRGLVPSQIVAITFTRAAAAELRARLTEGCLRRLRDRKDEREHWGQQLRRLDQALVGTIDVFVSTLLRRYGHLRGLPEAPGLLEPAAAREMASAVAAESLQVDINDPGAQLLLRQYDLRPAEAMVTRSLLDTDSMVTVRRQAKTASPEAHCDDHASAVAAEHEQSVARFLSKALDRYRERMAQHGLADYGHLLLRAVQLAGSPAVRAAFARDVALLAVDEHQDTSRLQMRLFQQLLDLPTPWVKGTPRGLFVGDHQQSIYRFRGAEMATWKTTSRLVTAAGGKTLTLTATFRARPSLVQAINDTTGALLRMVDPETDGAEDAVGAPMVAVRAEPTDAPAALTFLRTEAGAKETAEAVAAHLAECLRNPAAYPVTEKDGTVRPLAPRDIAILSPVLRGIAPAFVTACSAAGLPVRVQGGSGLFARPEVEDFVHALRAVVSEDPQEMLAWLSGPFGGVPISVLMHATEGVPLAATLSEATLGRGEPELIRALARRAVWRSLVDQLPHADIASRMLEESGALAHYARQADGLIATRNLARLTHLLSQAPYAQQSLWSVALRLRDIVAGRDYEEEAACFATGDDVITIATIHQAKGLEWPMVVLVGQDTSVAYRNFGEAPAIHPAWGVVLPLPVRLDDQEEVVEQTQSWIHYVRTQEAADAAESKRKLFVASTRARDYLVVAAPFTTARYPRDLTPTTVLSQSGRRNFDTMLRWWRFLGAPVLGTRGDAGSVTIGETTSAILNPPELMPLLPFATSRPPESLDAATLAARIGPVTPDAPLRAEISASELMMYDRCAWQHALQYRDGVNLPDLDVAAGDVIANRISPSERGTILHRYLRMTTGPSEMDMRRARMASAIRTTVSMPAAALEASVDAMMEHADTVEQSDWWSRVLAAKIVHREVSMTVPVGDRTLLRVVCDLVWQDPDGKWNIMDFKSLLLRGLTEEETEAEITRRTAAYRLQVASYVTALRRVLGPRAKLGHFVFLFSGTGTARSIPLGGARTKTAFAAVKKSLRGVQGPRPSGMPVWDEAKCNSCPVRLLCNVSPQAKQEEAA